jgi:hypothetical protein
MLTNSPSKSMKGGFPLLTLLRLLTLLTLLTLAEE